MKKAIKLYSMVVAFFESTLGILISGIFVIIGPLLITLDSKPKTIGWILIGVVVASFVLKTLNTRFTVLLAVELNPRTGIAVDRKNKIRQVDFRVDTIKNILLEVPSANLKPLAHQIGSDFVKNFSEQNLLHGETHNSVGGWPSNDDVNKKLKEWTKFDSKTGMGKIVAHVDTDKTTRDKHCISVKWISPFTSAHKSPLCDFLEGYCEGCLAELLKKPVSKTEKNCVDSCQDYCVFSVYF